MNKALYNIFLFCLLISTTIYSQRKKDSLYIEADKLKHKDPKLAIDLFERSYEQSLEKKDTVKAIDALIGKGKIHSHTMNYSRSYDDYWKALLLAEKIDSKTFINRLHQSLGWLYSFYNRDEEAIENFNKSIAISKVMVKKKYAPKGYIFSDYFALANFYRVRQQNKLHNIYLDSCIQSIDNVKRSYYLEAEIGYKLTLEKKYNKALKKLNESKKYFQENAPSYLVIINHLIGNTYKEKGDLSKAKLHFIESIDLSNRYSSHTNYKIMDYDKLTDIYRLEKNYEKAFHYQKLSKELNESIFGSKSENNQTLFKLKDTYRIAKEKQEKLEAIRKIKLLEQEEYIWFLKHILLGVCICFLIISIIIFIRNLKISHEKEKKTIEEKQKLELDRKNEVLELKNKELTASALQLIEKEEFLKNLKNKLSKQKDNVDVKVINRMVNTIQGSPSSNWKEFEARFTSINQSFYTNLKEKFPKLGQTDQKICALIKLNFSSKEMSSLLGISVESVHTSRYRLRKKLGLERNDSLSDFINSI
ncbi:tetratricopeptide (TPR) repeat protein [Wenyingzhuangia heitensis]|uniref:Tetratricopeptide (TPR) repeat protein n=1 Tax=Wenyingzhuangia heitensis TaxID=1487859 RepID=A0ABX0UFB8_9FLAO|nr:hypothetical protein [Wenyingzhuangia heitensis]NIJ45871.1 tetratricopeptide (TPR) repeat protein [Wenyingzhuangia heitensis]